MERYIAPSLLAADFTNLNDDIETINNSNAEWLHCDVMDGVFVPQISFGQPVIKHISEASKKPLDVHLMIVNPQLHIKTIAEAGANIITVHYEACNHLNRIINQIKEHNVLAGVSLNPHTPVNCLEDIISELDLVLIMSVNPGYGGQKFIENSYSKISNLKELIEHKGSKAKIEVDGGVTLQNAKQLYEAGADILVAGTSVFKSENPVKTIDSLLSI